MSACSGTRRAGSAWLVLLSYLVLFALLCLPWLREAQQALPVPGRSARDDTLLVTWILWWVAHSLAFDPLNVLNAPINYPAVRQLTGTESWASLQVVFFPIWAVTRNPILATNALLWLSYPLAALAMNRLLRALGFGNAIAWAIGLGFALGPHSVPPSANKLQMLSLFLPAVALAITRLRERPTLGRSFAFACAFGLGILSAYYMAAMLFLLLVPWGAAEAARPLPRRGPFLVHAVLAALVCTVALVVVSLPYLWRTEVGHGLELPESFSWTAHVRRFLATVRPAALVGFTLTGIGALGVIGLAAARWRRVALAGIAIVLVSLFAAAGGLFLLASLPLPAPIDAVAVLAQFFRVSSRFLVLTSFGLALLAAIALDLAGRRLAPSIRLAAAALIAAVFLLERGVPLFSVPLDRVAATAEQRRVYRTVGRLAGENGRGPLLELPLRVQGDSLQPEAMIGSMQHRLPLVSGHTGYLPPHRELVDEAAKRLPDAQALQDLVDMTGLRWILVRPESDWKGSPARSALLAGLLRLPGVGPAWKVDGWELVRVDRPAVHTGWQTLVARGTGPGRTPLGTPLVALSESDLAARIRLDADRPAFRAAAGSALDLTLIVENLGSQGWPASPRHLSPPPLTVRLRGEWRGPQPDLRESAALPRDVPPGESVRVDLRLATPQSPGSYELVLSLEQVDGARFAAERNPPLRVPVEIVPDT